MIGLLFQTDSDVINNSIFDCHSRHPCQLNSQLLWNKNDDIDEDDDNDNDYDDDDDNDDGNSSSSSLF